MFLPTELSPVVAGRVDRIAPTTPDGDDSYAFTYGRSYLANERAIPIYRDLPLRPGVQQPVPGLQIAGSLLDATPDSWGRRVIHERLAGPRDRASDPVEFDLLTYMLASGSDRTGAIDFQESATDYVARGRGTASLSDLLKAAELIESGQTLPESLNDALALGTTAGGARPKALVDHGGESYIAKFPSSTDSVSVVKAEAVAMELARRVGIATAETKLVEAAGRDVLLVKRFDRPSTGGRTMVVSALTILGVRPESSRGLTSYPELAQQVRQLFRAPTAANRELFQRMVFNVIVRNTDDHARNHAAFWDGEYLDFTPAFDLTPTIAARPDADATHPMALSANGDRLSRLSVCLAAAPSFGLTDGEARAVIDDQVRVVLEEWDDAAATVGLSDAQSEFMWGRQILNNAIFWGLEEN